MRGPLTRGSARPGEQSADGRAKLVEIEGLIQDRVNGVLRPRPLCVSAYHQNRLVRNQLLDSGGKFAALHEGNFEVRYHQIELSFVKEGQCLRPVISLDDGVFVLAEQQPDGFANWLLILNQQDALPDNLTLNSASLN